MSLLSFHYLFSSGWKNPDRTIQRLSVKFVNGIHFHMKCVVGISVISIRRQELDALVYIVLLLCSIKFTKGLNWNCFSYRLDEAVILDFFAVAKCNYDASAFMITGGTLLVWSIEKARPRFNISWQAIIFTKNWSNIVYFIVSGDRIGNNNRNDQVTLNPFNFWYHLSQLISIRTKNWSFLLTLSSL